METCERCESTDIIEITAKCSDMCSITRGNTDYGWDYVNPESGVGGGDYIQFRYCANCGQIVGDFPIPQFTKEDDE